MATIYLKISLSSSEIIYDVKDKTHLAAQAAGAAGASYELVSAMQVTDDAERRNLLLRFIDSAVARVRHVASEYHDGGHTETNNTLVANNFNIYLKMPSNYAIAATDDVGKSIHNFITDYAIGRWFETVDAGRAKAWQAEAEANLVALVDALHRRVRPKPRSSSDGGGGSGSGGGESEDVHIMWKRGEGWKRDEQWRRT